MLKNVGNHWANVSHVRKGMLICSCFVNIQHAIHVTLCFHAKIRLRFHKNLNFHFQAEGCILEICFPFESFPLSLLK